MQRFDCTKEMKKEAVAGNENQRDSLSNVADISNMTDSVEQSVRDTSVMLAAI
nr:hypothetical protein [uncultured Desulfuromonas sp.]